MDEGPLSSRWKLLLGFLFFIHYAELGNAVDPILPAMGRPALLGEFYDARNQSFLGVTIFRDEIPPGKLIKTIDTTQSDIKYGIVDSSKSKIFHLDVSAEIKVEMMSGKLKVSGSAAYFNEDKKSALEVEGFLQYKTRTKREVLNLLYDQMKPYLKLETLEKVEATHIVIAIEYGADVVIKFLNKVDNKEDQTKIQGALELAFTVEKISIAASASVNLEEGKEDKFSNFSLNVYGDINLGSTMPQNMKDVMKLINKVPEKLRENNDGKGVPMIYTLFPISTLAELVNNDKLQQKIVNDLDEAILNDFVKMFDEISRVQQELNDLEAKVKYYSNCTSGEDIARVKNLNRKFSDAALQFKLEAREAMDTARVMTTPPPGTAVEKPDKNLQPTESPVAEVEEEEEAEAEAENPEDAPSRKRRSISQKETRDLMKKVLLEYQSREFSVDKVSVRIETEFQLILNKIELYKVFQDSGVEYFGRFGTFNNLRLKNSDKILYAIYMLESSSPEWENNWELFLNQLKRPFSHLAIVDCDFKDGTCLNIQSGENKTVMRQYYRAKMISKDVYADLTRSKTAIGGERPVLIVSSVGRAQEIGDLYNSKIHQFTGKSVLEPGTNLTKINMTTTDFSNETMDIVNNELEEKFRVMGIQPPALQYNILLNPKGMQGVGRTFLEMRGFQPQWISSTLYHVYNTISESILDVDAESFDFISISRLLKGGATHFVKQIVWGAQTTISLSTPLPDDNDISSAIFGSTTSSNDLVPKLRGDLVKIWDILMSKSKMEVGEEPEKISKIPLSPLNYEIKFASDIFQNARNEFRTEKDLVDFLNDFPRLKLKANKGKGRPVLYVLYPLENLQQYFGVIPGMPDDPTELENSALSLEFARVFEAFYEAEEKIVAMKKVFNKKKLYINDQTLDEFLGVERSFQRMKKQLLDKLRDLVKDKDDEKLKEWLLQMKAGATGVKFFNATGNAIRFTALDKFSNVVEKLEFFQYFSKEHPHIKYFGREKLFTKEMTTYTSGEFVYVLFYRMELFAQKDPSWVDNFDLMTRHLAGKPYNKLILMDCDFEDEACKGIEKCVIHLFRNTKLISENVLEEWDEGIDRLLEKKAFSLKRNSIGRPVRLGALYNVRTENLLDKNILDIQKIQGHPDQHQKLFIMTPALEKIEVKTLASTDLTERYTALEMEPEVQFALLFQGQGKNLEGSAGFLNENLEFSKATIFTVEQHSATLNLDAKDLPYFFQSSSLDGSDGPTHFVKQIKFGSNTVFALGNAVKDEDVQFLEKNLGSLEAQAQARVAPAVVSVLKETTKRRRIIEEPEVRRLTNLELLEDFKIFTDLALQHQVKVIKGGNLTDLVFKISMKAKSIPFAYELSDSITSVSFILEPLESLQRPLGILSPSYNYQPLPETFQVSQSVEKYQAFQRALNETAHLETELLSPSFKGGMSNSSLEKIEEIHHDLIAAFTKFKIHFRDELEAVKNGSRLEAEDPTSKLKEIVAEFKDVLTVDGKYIRLDELEPEREKLKLLKYISAQSGAQSHITYLGRDRNFNNIVFSSASKKYVLYFKNLMDLANSPLWLNTTDVFFKLAVQGEECFIIDCDFPGFNCTDLAKPIIYEYQDGVLTSSDYAVTVVIKKNQTASEMDHQQKWLKNLQETVDDLGKNFQVEQAAVETIRGKLNENVGVVTKLYEEYNSTNQNVTGGLKKLQDSLTTVQTEVIQIGENLQTSMVAVQGNFSKLDAASETSVKTLHSVQEKLNDSLVPVGFIYIQYMKQLPPQEIWPQYTWSDISVEYSGLFFRTDGNGTYPFEGLETQEETSPRIRQFGYDYQWTSSSQYYSYLDIKYDSFSATQRLNLGQRPDYKSGLAYQHLDVKTTGDATVTPRNQAIRIWKRVADPSKLIPSRVTLVLRSPRATKWGTWGAWEYCPEGDFVSGLQLKTESWVGSGDNTALNGITLFCKSNTSLNEGFGGTIIRSKEGKWGSWAKTFMCPGKEKAIGFQLRAQTGGSFKSSDTGKGWGASGKDEVGATNLRLICENNKSIEGDGLLQGDWTTERRCLPKTVLCGIQTQVEDWVGSGDDTALNNVDMACCKYQ